MTAPVISSTHIFILSQGGSQWKLNIPQDSQLGAWSLRTAYQFHRGVLRDVYDSRIPCIQRYPRKWLNFRPINGHSWWNFWTKIGPFTVVLSEAWAKLRAKLLILPRNIHTSLREIGEQENNFDWRLQSNMDNLAILACFAILSL